MFSRSKTKPAPGDIVVLLISEPWGFNSPAGENTLKVRFVRQVGNPNDPSWLAKTDTELDFEEKRGRFFVISTRHKGITFADYRKGADFPVNIGMVSADVATEAEFSLEKDVTLVMVGSIEKIRS